MKMGNDNSGWQNALDSQTTPSNIKDLEPMPAPSDYTHNMNTHEIAILQDFNRHQELDQLDIEEDSYYEDDEDDEENDEEEELESENSNNKEEVIQIEDSHEFKQQQQDKRPIQDNSNIEVRASQTEKKVLKLGNIGPKLDSQTAKEICGTEQKTKRQDKI